MRKIIFLGGWLAVAGVAHAQFTYRLDQSVPVVVNEQLLANAWAGGLNSVQVSTMDLDNDGQEDLVVFDRASDKLSTFLRQGTFYRYAPEYESQFPDGISQWLLLRDFNCDGKKDIFTSHPLGIRVIVNSSTPTELRWRFFNNDAPLLTIGFSPPNAPPLPINLQIDQQGLPAIEDIDGDGDLDVLNVRFVGIGSIEWHKNLSMDSTGTCDSLQMRRVTQRYGGVTECNCGVFAFNNESCANATGRTQHAGGKALLTLDVDNDGDHDLLMSEEGCARIYLLRNEGTTQNPIFQSATIFPSTSPVALLFATPFFEDVDGDGIKDLLVSPNAYDNSAFSPVDFENSILYFKNTGTNTAPFFRLQQRNFLQDSMLDVGKNASPAFFDVDNDGDYDMFISSSGIGGFDASLRYYENRGTATEPRFEWVTDDYLNLSLYSLYNLRPHFADINADTRPDLIFTATGLFTGLTNVYVVRNTAPEGFAGDVPQALDFEIGATETVLVTDVNQDGLADLLVGRATGAVNYYQNVGSGNAPSFALEDAAFVGLGNNTSRQNPALAIADLDADGTADLVMGNQRGRVSVFPNYRNALPESELTTILFDTTSQGYIEKNFGGRIVPAVANLFNTSRPALVLGTVAGGLFLLRNEDLATLPDEPVISLFPNPAKANEQVVTIRADRSLTVSFFTALGQPLGGTYLLQPFQDFPFQMQNLPQGLYIARFTWRGRTYSRRLVIVN
ncbi:MAG: T9SS type A sorting domain-containing protein [Cyclobacteriaceae bacterium]|nr:T9SS type A sorting domain-containing protein [Cyclobacteriaceae bacterium]